MLNVYDLAECRRTLHEHNRAAWTIAPDPQQPKRATLILNRNGKPRARIVRVARKNAPANYEILTLDNRGHGKSSHFGDTPAQTLRRALLTEQNPD